MATFKFGSTATLVLASFSLNTCSATFDDMIYKLFNDPMLVVDISDNQAAQDAKVVKSQSTAASSPHNVEPNAAKRKIKSIKLLWGDILGIWFCDPCSI